MEENLRQLQKENHGLKIDLQNAQMEMKNQKKILEMEIGSDFVNSSQLLGNGFKGRSQQIIALQSRVKELERIKEWFRTINVFRNKVFSILLKTVTLNILKYLFKNDVLGEYHEPDKGSNSRKSVSD